jgi:hypothetical protein
MKYHATQSNPIEYERNLKAEQLKVSEAQAILNEGGFVPLAEAARQAQVPLSTLAHAVRHGKLPGLQVQPRRWLVRLEAVKLWQRSGDDKPPELRALEAMVAEGLLDAEDLVYPRPRPHKINPAQLTDGGPSLSQMIIDERR